MVKLETVSTMNITSGNCFFSVGDFLDGIEHAGGGLVVNERQRVELARGELFRAPAPRDGLAPLDLQLLGLLAAALRNVIPLVRERAAAAVEHLLLHQVADASPP